VSWNASFMSCSPETDIAERQCQWNHLIYKKRFTTVRSDGPPSMNTTYTASALTAWCVRRCQMPGVCRMSTHAAWMRSKRSASVPTVVSCTKVLRCPQTKNSNGLRSDDRAGHATGLPRPIDLPGYALFRWLRTWILKWAGAPSCMYHML
jgi:hypothetical protein